MKKTLSILFLMVLSSSAFSTENKAGVGKLDSQLTCEQATTKIKSKEFETLPELEQLEIMLVSTTCIAQKHNEKNPDDPVVVVSGPDKNAPASAGKRKSRVYFDLIHIKDAENLATGCAYAAGAAGLLDPTGETATLIGAVGEYSCGAYFEAALKDDPLLIFAPNMVPGNKLTTKVLSYIGLGDDYEKAVEEASKPLKEVTQEIVNAGKKEAENIKKGKPSAADIIAPTVTAPAKIVCKILFNC